MLAGLAVACGGGEEPSSRNRTIPPDVAGAGDTVHVDALANGRRIFRSATSRFSPAISSTGATRPDGKPLLSCADCHGSRGEGGLIISGQSRVPAPAILFGMLTDERQRVGLPPYTDATFGLTLRTGVTPDGRKLDLLMPRWQLTAEDLNDLILYIKSLSPPPGDTSNR